MFASFVFESGHDAFGGGVDDIAGGWIGARPVDTEGDPAGLIPQLNAHLLFGRHHGGVEDVNAAVRSVSEPEFRFVGSERDTVARTTVPLGGALLIAMHLDTIQFLPRLAVSHFKAKQIVDV